jgi:hypothetical protein
MSDFLNAPFSVVILSLSYSLVSETAQSRKCQGKTSESCGVKRSGKSCHVLATANPAWLSEMDAKLLALSAQCTCSPRLRL